MSENTAAVDSTVATSAAIAHPIFDNKVDKTEVKFNFKKSVTKDESTGLEVESKRPSITIALPLLSIEGLVAAINAGDKSLELVLEAVREVQIARARELINEKEDISAENFPYEALAWDAIANLPKADRRGGGIAKEVWEEFAKDYIAVMPGLTNKTLEQVTNASKILLNKFSAVKTAKPIISMLLDQLGLYVTNSKNAEAYMECVEFLQSKGKALLNMTEADLLANL